METGMSPVLFAPPQLLLHRLVPRQPIFLGEQSRLQVITNVVLDASQCCEYSRALGARRTAAVLGVQLPVWQASSLAQVVKCRHQLWGRTSAALWQGQGQLHGHLRKPTS